MVAFPGAMGYAASTNGARSAPGSLIHRRVTNLNDSGAGSLRAALTTDPGANNGVVVTFTVGGYCDLDTEILMEYPYFTVLGQTAPGDGFCLRANADDMVLLLISGRIDDGANADNIIFRNMSFKSGRQAGWTNDATDRPNLVLRNTNNVIFHECTFQFGSNEGLNVQRRSTTQNEDTFNITFSRCVFSDNLVSRNMLFDVEGDTTEDMHEIDVVECVIGNANSRCPKLTGVNYRFVGNVIYDNAEGSQGQFDVVADFIRNYAREGPLTDWSGFGSGGYRLFGHEFTAGDTPTYYREGNVVDRDGLSTLTDQTAIFQRSDTGADLDAGWVSGSRATAVAAVEIRLRADADAYYAELVTAGRVGNYRRINENGQWENRSDGDLSRFITDVANREAQHQVTLPDPGFPNSSYIHFPTQLAEGGMATLAAGTAYTDSGADGMGDAWQTANSVLDGENLDLVGGYTNIERFANGPGTLLRNAVFV